MTTPHTALHAAPPRQTVPLPVHLPVYDGLFTTVEALRVGLSRPQLAAWVDAGRLRRVARGVLTDRPAPATPSEPHLERARACLLARPGSRAAHETALVLHGVAVWPGSGTVHLTSPAVLRSRRARGVVLHPPWPDREPEQGVARQAGAARGPWPAEPVAVALARYACRRDTSVEQVVVSLDAALHRGLVGPEEVLALVGSRTPGRRCLVAALRAADARSESPGETRARLLLQGLGLEVRTQVQVPAGGVLYRVDLALEGEQVAVEFDGAVKYEGVDGREALVREKRREDAIRGSGWEVVRLTWRELDQPERVRALVEDARRRSRGR